MKRYLILILLTYMAIIGCSINEDSTIDYRNCEIQNLTFRTSPNQCVDNCIGLNDPKEINIEISNDSLKGYVVFRYLPDSIVVNYSKTYSSLYRDNEYELQFNIDIGDDKYNDYVINFTRAVDSTGPNVIKFDMNALTMQFEEQQHLNYFLVLGEYDNYFQKMEIIKDTLWYAIYSSDKLRSFKAMMNSSISMDIRISNGQISTANNYNLEKIDTLHQCN